MIIGLTGQLQSGKDTVADYLVKEYEFEKVGFSDALYECVGTLFDLDRETVERFKVEGMECLFVDRKQWPRATLTHGITMREILQRMGTDVVRDIIGQDTWANILAHRIASADDNKPFVVRDVRFDNEAKTLKLVDFDTHIWRIVRPGYEGDSHVSEAGIKDSFVDEIIPNAGTLEELYNVVSKKMETAVGKIGS